MIALNWEKKKKYEQEIISEGSYVLRTDWIDLSDEEIWNTYIMLGNIEYTWLTISFILSNTGFVCPVIIENGLQFATY